MKIFCTHTKAVVVEHYGGDAVQVTYVFHLDWYFKCGLLSYTTYKLFLSIKLCFLLEN